MGRVWRPRWQPPVDTSNSLTASFLTDLKSRKVDDIIRREIACKHGLETGGEREGGERDTDRDRGRERHRERENERETDTNRERDRERV